MKKQEMLDIIDHFPDEIDPDEFMNELYLRVKIERAEAAVAEGKVFSHEEVVKRSQEWFE
jgi:hypothetical protein